MKRQGRMSLHGLARWVVAGSLAVAFSAGFGAAVEARPKHGPKGPGIMMFDPELLEEAAKRIGLEDSTLGAIKDRVYAVQKEMIPLEAELKGLRLELHRLLDGDAPDRAHVMRLVDQVGNLEARLQKTRIGLLLDVRSKLTPEQVRQVREMRHEFREKRKQWRSRSGEGSGEGSGD